MSIRVGWIAGSLGIAVAVVLAAFAGGVFALRAFAQPVDGVIYACEGERSGALRVVNGPDDCLRGEEPIEWNIAGPQGEPGPTGPVGPAGPAGPAGISIEPATKGPLTVDPGATLTNVVGCPPNHTALSGGVQIAQGSLSDLIMAQSFGTGGPSWFITVVNPSVAEIQVNLVAMCTPNPPD